MGILDYSRHVLLLSAALTVSSCGFDTGGNAPGESSSALSAALSCGSPSTTILDRGVKAGVTATARGVWSDTKYIPSGVAVGTGAASGNVIQSSSNVGVAFVDTGAKSLKYSFWNGSTFKTELVFGNSVANITYVRLGFLSNAPNTGLPIIFFTNGAVNNGQIMMAVRSSPRFTVAGTWSVQMIDADGGASNRALELSISPADQVGLVYQATSLPTANNIRFIYCSTNCHLPGSYSAQGSSATSRVDAGANALQVHLGIGWCQVSNGVYNPAVVYGASATAFQFAICKPGTNDLSSCGTSAGWTRTTATIPASGASGRVADLHLDASISNDFPKIMIKDAGSSLRTFTTSEGCSDVSTASTYSAAGASAIVGSGGANIGTSHFRLLKSADYTTPSNERFFLVVNDGTTAIRWAATSSSAFNGAWNANATGIIQTVTLNAAGATNFGADINTSSRQLISSYGTAAGLFNITLGVVNDYANPSDPSSAAQSYSQLPVDSSGHIQLASAQQKNIAVSSNSRSFPATAWIDFSSGVGTTGRLKYALRGGARATDSWQVYAVPGVTASPAPQNPSLAFDHLDRPWIGYWDAQGATGRFVLATNTASDGSGTWTSYMFPVSGSHGAPSAQPAANETAVAMSYSNGLAVPVMIVIDNGTTKAVKSAKLNPNTGAWSSVTTIEALSAQGAAFLSADWSKTSNLVAVAYQTLATGAVRVRYSASTDGTSWPVNGANAVSVSGAGQGEGVQIRINPATGRPSIAYYDRTNARLYFVTCTNNCTGSENPTFAGASNSILNGLGITGLSVVGNSNLLDASLTYSAAGDAYLAYNSGALDRGGIYLVDSVGGALPSGAGVRFIGGVNGAFSNADASNGGIPWGQKVVRLPNGALAAVYNAPGNSLAITTCGD